MSNYGQPRCLHVQRPQQVRLRLSVDVTHNGGQGIDRETDVPKFRAQEHTLTDQRAMRAGLIMTTAQHVAALAARYPAERVEAYSGAGNLLANPGYVAWVEGTLFHLAGEPIYKRAYTCLTSWKDGAVTVEELWFAREDGRVVLLRQNHTVEDVTDAVAFVVSGPPLFRRGEAVRLEAIAAEFYDTRHLLQPLCLTLNGLTCFVPNAQLQQGLLRVALCRPVHVRLEAHVEADLMLPLTLAGWERLLHDHSPSLAKTAAFLREHGILHAGERLEHAEVLQRVGQRMEHCLDEALLGAGYTLVNDSRRLQQGEARYINGHLEIALRHALYPHSLFVRWEDGTYGVMAFRGKSGREGMTLPAVQDALRALRVHDAVLLDNGGDVRLIYRGVPLVASSEQREEIRALLALTVPQGTWCSDTLVVF